MQKYLLSGFSVLVASLIVPVTINAQGITTIPNEQQAVFEELYYLNQNFENPIRQKNGFSLIAATYELYNPSLQFVKATDSTRYRWAGNRGATFDVTSHTGMLNAVTYSGLIFKPLTDASAMRNAMYDFDTIEYYPLLINANTYGDLYRRKIATVAANATVSAHSEERLFNNNNWQENTNTTYLFDNQNRLIELLEKRNLNGVLTNYSKVNYTYNSADKVTMITSHLWIGGTWTNSYKYSYGYDINNNLIDYAVETWQSNAWSKLTRVLQEYNSNAKVISRISQMGATGNWENARKWEYSYLSNNVVTIESRPWSSGSWGEVSNLYAFDYNNLNQCVTRTESVISSPDTTISRTLYNYNSVNEIDHIVWQNGGATKEEFKDHERWVFEYSNAGLTGHYSQRYSNNAWSFFYNSAAPGDQSFFHHYYYSDTNTTSISRPKNISLNFAVYPNPGSTNLSVAIEKEAIKYITITDLSGKVVLKTSYTTKVNKAEVDVSGIAAGNYLLSAGNESGYGVKQISIIK